MDASQIVLTAEGRQKLVEELAWREGDYAKEIVEDIKEARAFGDLSENSEYDAAKDKQAQNAARIAEIQAILANAQVAATTGDLTVSIGSTVSLIDPNGEVMEVTLVGTTETNSLEHKISNESPVGHAIIGHGEGDSVEVVTPSGKTLLAITNLPPRKMMGIPSCGMLISAIHEEEGEERLNLIQLDDSIPAGAKMY